MSRLADMIERWAPVALMAGLLAFTVSLVGCISLGPQPGSFGPVQAVQGVPAGVMAQVPGDPSFIGPVAPLAKSAKVEVAGAKAAGGLNTWGTLALIAGCVVIWIPRLPDGLGLGLITGGLVCLEAGILLPIYAAEIGLGLAAAVVIFYLAKLRPEHLQDAGSRAREWVAGVLSPLTSLFTSHPKTNDSK